jgi:transcriptional regulator with XRE-family HTH domain
MNIGQRVREAREALGMQRTVLARRVGVAENTIYRIETAKRTPSVELLEKIARELRTEPADLFKEPVPLGEASQETEPEKRLSEEAGEERHPDDEVTRRRIYTGLAAERASLLESMAELWDRLLDRGEHDIDTLRQIEHVTLTEIINHAIDEEEIKEGCAPEQRDQLARSEQRLLEADRRVSRAIEAKLPTSEIDKWRAARAERQAKFPHLGIPKLA